MFNRKKNQQLDKNKLPTHICFIIDGNGRWAKKRGLPRSAGHQVGFENVKTIFKAVQKIGIKHMSVFAFSTENWNRPKSEVDFLIGKLKEMLKSNFLEELDFKPKFIACGDISRFDEEIQMLIKQRMEETKNNTDITFNLCINYGGRNEIVNAVNTIIKDKNIKEISVENFGNYLYTAGQPDPDLIIRTSGEYRISGFMLWQCAYSEFMFPKKCWPAFTEKDLIDCLLDYQNRDRRFGNVK